MGDDFRVWIKRQGEVAFGVVTISTLLGSIFMGIVWITGGHFPPWATSDEVRRIMKEALVSVYAYQDAHDCSDYNDRFRRAQAAKQRNGNDQTAIDLFNVSLDKLKSIPNCMPEILPAEIPQQPPGRPGSSLSIP
jgi:hypothetical protein